MSGRNESWGWVPNLPAPVRDYTLAPRTLKPQPVHTEEELAKAKQYPRGAEGAKTKKTGFLLAMDYATAQQLRLEI